MVTKTYKQDPEGFKLAWLSENNKKGIRIEFPEFKERVRPVGTENPKALGWYEHNKKRQMYVLTEDTSVIEDKYYFKMANKPLIYTDSEIENDSFSLKRSIQSGNNVDFIGCISSSVKFKVYNDFYYIKDQKMTVTLTVLSKAGTQTVTGRLGTFRVGNEYNLPTWDINDTNSVYEIKQLGVYDAVFKVLATEYNYHDYLEQCQIEHVGLSCKVIIPDSINDVLYEMKSFTGTVYEIKLDKSKNLTREITAYDYMHKLADDYDVTDWYVWQYGDSNADNAQAEIQTYSSHTDPEICPDAPDYFPYEGKEDILYYALNSQKYYKWIPQPYLEDPDEPPGYYQSTTRNYRTRTIKQLRDSFWQFIGNTGTVYDPTGQALKQKGEGFTQVNDATLINDSIVIPKTLNVSPVDFDPYISGDRVGGPFERHPKTKTETGDYSPFPEYDNYTVTSGWNVNDLVARKQIIELGLVGTLFTYGSKTETHYREYMDDCDNAGSGIRASIKIPREEQDKLRETQITAATVLQCLCQYNGVFGQFNADGEFEYIEINTNDTYEIDERYQIEVGYSDMKMPDITGVVIFDKTSEEYGSDNIQTEYGSVKNGKKGTALAYYPDDRTKVEGPDSHAYIIDDNFLFNAFNQVDAIGVCKTLYNQIKGITVRNSNLTIKAMPWLKCGQAINYYIPNENTLYPREDLAPSEYLAPCDYEKVTSLIMSYEISGTGLLKGKIECKVEDISSQIVNLNEVISSEMFYRKIGDNRTYSEFLQTANEIKLSVTDKERKLTSYIDVRADAIELEVSGPGGIKSRLAITEREISAQADTITLMGNTISAQADSINFITNNYVSFTAAGDPQSQTFIHGGNIKTNTINGDTIIANSISCDRLKASSITANDGRTYTVNWINMKNQLITGSRGVQYRNTNNSKLGYGNLKTISIAYTTGQVRNAAGTGSTTAVTGFSIMVDGVSVASTSMKIPENYDTVNVLVTGQTSNNYTITGYLIKPMNESSGNYSVGIEEQKLVTLGNVTNWNS